MPTPESVRRGYGNAGGFGVAAVAAQFAVLWRSIRAAEFIRAAFHWLTGCTVRLRIDAAAHALLHGRVREALVVMPADGRRHDGAGSPAAGGCSVVAGLAPALGPGLLAELLVSCSSRNIPCFRWIGRLPPMRRRRRVAAAARSAALRAVFEIVHHFAALLHHLLAGGGTSRPGLNR